MSGVQPSDHSGFYLLRTALPAALLLAGLTASPVSAASGGSVRTFSNAHADAYALSLNDNMMSMNLSIEQIERLRAKRSGDLFWFRRSGKAYRIEDRTAIAEANALFAPLRALEPEQDDLRRREEALEKKDRVLDREEEELDRQVDAMVDADDTDDGDHIAEEAPNPVSDAKLRELRHKLEDVRARQRELAPQSRELENADRELDAREEAIEREAEAKLWKLIDAAVRNGLAIPDAR